MILQLICHVVHIAATCISLGGLFYSRMVLLPNLHHVPEDSRDAYLGKMIVRFGYIKWVGIVILAVTGIIQWMDVYPTVPDKQSYIIAFIIKMLAAIGLLSVTFLLSLPDDRLKGMQKNRAFWSGLNIVFGIIILVGAALMRAVRNGELTL